MAALGPTIHTDAYEDSFVRNVPIIFLAGPIKHWWSCQGSPEHLAYLRHRESVRGVLIANGYLTYTAWDAIKGTWDYRAQAINDTAISVADLMIDLTPPGVPADGTESERSYAERVGTPWFAFPPDAIGLIGCVKAHVGPGKPWDAD